METRSARVGLVRPMNPTGIFEGVTRGTTYGLLGALPIVALSLGCLAPAEERSAPGAVVPLDSLVEHARWIGVLGGAEGEGAWLSGPRHAFLDSRTGRVLVLDDTPPFVLVVEADGSSRRMVARGDGPSEVRGPKSVVPVSESVSDVAILAHDALVRFDSMGRAVSRQRLPFTPLALVRGCGGLVVYGVDLSRREGRTWLHLYTTDLQPVDWRGLVDHAEIGAFFPGRRYLIAADDQDIWLVHDYAQGGSTLLRVSCENAVVHQTIAQDLLTPPILTAPAASGDGSSARTAVTYPDTTAVGMLLTSAGLLFMERIRPSASADSWGEMALVHGDHLHRGGVSDGRLRLLGGGGGTGIVLSTREPFPRLAIIDESVLVQVLTRSHR